MDITNDIIPLTDFKRQTKEVTEHLRETSRPVVLTVNGKASLVVLDAAAWQQIQDQIDRLEKLVGLRRGLDDALAGQGIDARIFSMQSREETGVKPKEVSFKGFPKKPVRMIRLLPKNPPTMSVVFTPQAQESMRIAYTSANVQGPAQATSWLDTNREKIRLALAKNPAEHPVAPETRLFGIEIREVTLEVPPARILFRIEKALVQVLDVQPIPIAEPGK
jgi:prevent-host-death family protein